jgi:hypothetical protein
MAKPVDPADATRIFSWLICESYGNKGKVILYGYKTENSDNANLSGNSLRCDTWQIEA